MRFITPFAIGIALLAAAGCAGSERREYQLQGQILSVSPDRLQADVKHEEIPGFMPAMTMPYKVRDAAEFSSLQPGDLINATLVVISNDAYLEQVRKVGAAPLEQPAGAPTASSGFELLKPGEAVPNVTFIDQDGRPREFASFEGAPVVVTFIYTRCPIPTFCPLMDRHFAAIQARVKEDPALRGVRLVSVSFDPIGDTPPVLKKHAETLGADPDVWTFLTGDRDEVDRFASRFGVSITRAQNDPIDIAHNLRTAIVGADGTLVKTYTGNEWTPAQVLEDLAPVARTN
jgi:protein SCO1/2